MKITGYSLEEQCLVPTLFSVAHNCQKLQLQGICRPLLASVGTAPTGCTDINTGKIPKQMITFLKKSIA